MQSSQQTIGAYCPDVYILCTLDWISFTQYSNKIIGLLPAVFTTYFASKIGCWCWTSCLFHRAVVRFSNPGVQLHCNNIFLASVLKGAFNNYVDRILPFYASSCVDSFYTLTVDKNRHFSTPSPLIFST